MPRLRRAEPVASAWKSLLLRGLLALLVGAFAVFFPFNTLLSLTLAIAALAGLDGIFSIAAAFQKRCAAAPARTALAVRGVLGISLGAATLVVPFLATIAYSTVGLSMFAAWAIVAGLLDLAPAVRGEDLKGHRIGVASGVLSILFGLALALILFIYPTGFIALAWVVAIYGLAIGGTLLTDALRLKWIAGLAPASDIRMADPA